jgi:hypothetical protein
MTTAYQVGDDVNLIQGNHQVTVGGNLAHWRTKCDEQLDPGKSQHELEPEYLRTDQLFAGRENHAVRLEVHLLIRMSKGDQ